LDSDPDAVFAQFAGGFVHFESAELKSLARHRGGFIIRKFSL
jgi:hypothetical protein